MDSLLINLKNSGIGCYVNSCYAGALCYADDVTLLCPSLHGLNVMVETCVNVANDFNVTFNHKKTVALHFGKIKIISGSVYLDGNLIKWNDSVKHLGNIISQNLSDDKDCNFKKSCFIGSVNKLIGNFGRMYSHVKSKLFLSYCTSFYGSQMWRLSCNGIAQLCTSWQVAIRRLLHLPRNSHRWALGPLINCSHIRTQLELRTLSFIFKFAASKNVLVNSIFNVAISDARSDLGFNIAHFRSKYQIFSFNCIVASSKIIVNSSFNVINADQQARVNAARELLACRDNLFNFDFPHSDIDFFIETCLCK